MKATTRTSIGVAWMAGALLYAAYAAYTYSRLFLRACDWQDHIFGAHDSSVAFVATALLCSLPAFLVAPGLWKPRSRPNTAGVAATPDPAGQRRIAMLLGAGCLLVGIVAGVSAWTASHRTQVVATVDLVEGVEPGDVGRADRLIVNGMQHLDASQF